MSEAKTGKLIHDGGRYFLEVGKQRTEVSTDLVDEKVLRELSGHDVSITWSEPLRIPVALSGPEFKRPRILCYLPPPWPLKGVLVSHPEVQTMLLNKFAEAGIITKAVHEQFGR